jgi:hypothetical protein
VVFDLVSVQNVNDGLSAIKNLVEIAKQVLSLKDESEDKAERAKLQGALIEAQSVVLKMQETYLALLAAKQQLEKEVARLEAWDEEKENYGLQEIAPMVFAYAQKAQSAGPVHWLCQSCFDNGKKSMLHRQHHASRPTMKCYECGAEYSLEPPPHRFGRLER